MNCIDLNLTKHAEGGGGGVGSAHILTADQSTPSLLCPLVKFGGTGCVRGYVISPRFFCESSMLGAISGGNYPGDYSNQPGT